MWTMFLQLIGVIAALAAGGWAFLTIIDKFIYVEEDDE